MGTKENAAKAVIVVADDFSDTGALALSHSLRMARAGDASVHVVHVVTEADLAAVPGKTRMEKQDQLIGDLPSRLWDRIGTAGESVVGLSEIEVHVHVRIGKPAEALDQAAADYDADVIVVGTHGRRGVEKLILGSVAQGLVQNAHCPVLVVRPKDFAHARKSEHPEAAVPGEDLHAQRPRPSHVYTSSQTLSWSTHDVETQGVKMP